MKLILLHHRQRRVSAFTELKRSEMLMVPCSHLFADKEDLRVDCHDLFDLLEFREA